MKIKKISAREILDSRGNPTVEAQVELESGILAKASVPSGASTGSREAVELRDKDQARFAGKGVQTACKNIEEIIFPQIKGMDVFEQKSIDKKMLQLDGTENKSHLGANSILAVSLAACRAGSIAKQLPLWKYIRTKYALKSSKKYRFPVPMLNVINGGAHSDSGLDVQEFMLVPTGLESFSGRIRAGAEIYQILGQVLQENNYHKSVGDEGGYAPVLQSNQEALKLILDAIKESSYLLGKDIFTGIDAAASEFFNQTSGQYILKLDGVSLDSNQISAMYREWVDKYSIELIEDPLSESDWEGWSKFNSQVGNKISIIADDLTVTNKNILAEAIDRKASNAVLIKVNQIGTLSETIDCIKLAKENQMKIAVSHRSGETTDDFIADLAIAVEADYVKFGAPARGERVVKYNRIMEIEQTIKASK